MRVFYVITEAKNRYNLRGNTSLFVEESSNPNDPCWDSDVYTAGKLCLKLEHKDKGLMTDYTFLVFLLFVLLFTAYGRNSWDQPIRKFNDTYPRPFSINNVCA